MSNRDINPYDYYKNFFERSVKNQSFMNFFNMNIFKEFYHIQEEMEKVFNQFNDVKYNPPRELIREYETEDGVKIREVGQIVYGYSMTIGTDGRPHIREFGNIKKSRPSENSGTIEEFNLGTEPRINGEREPLADINVTDKEIKVILEMPGVGKENIKLDIWANNLDISTTDGQRKYKRMLEIPKEADTNSAKSTYTNGILEITFNKRTAAKSKSREIKID